MKPADSAYGGQARAAHLHPFVYRSIAATHAGCVRAINEDAVLDRPDIGLWAVADGMGGHHAGDVASALVVDELGNVDAFESAYAFRAGVSAALKRANARLQAAAIDALADMMGATVVTLLVHGAHYACLWAGDSRAYLLRRGVFQRLTRDHTLAESAAAADRRAGQGGANVVTRAVGAHSELELDCVFGDLRPGDRFLLCSDGLAVVDEMLIAGELEATTQADCAARLIRKALAYGAPDNVSLVVLDCLATSITPIRPPNARTRAI